MLLPIAGCSPSNMSVTSLTTSPQHHLVAKFPLQVLYDVTPDISIILHFTFYQPIFYAAHDQHFPSDSEERAGSWLVLLSIVVILSLTWYLMLKPSKSSIEVLSGSGLLKTPIRGLLMLEGRKISSLTPDPPNIQLQRQMMRIQLNKLPLLSTSNQGMMVVQPQASLWQNSTLLEGPFYYPLATMGRD